MSQQEVLIFVYPVKSHFISLMGLASFFKEKNFTVSFVGKGNQIEGYVLNQGFNYYGLQSYPFAMNFEKFIASGNGKIANYFSNIYYRLTDYIYISRQEEIQNLVERVKPAIIFVDQKISSDFVILYPLIKRYKFKVVFIQTMLNTYKNDFNVPITCKLLPSNNLRNFLVWKLYQLQKDTNRILEYLLYWGYDNESLILRKLKANNVPFQFWKNKLNFFQFSFKSITELILAPEELEFSIGGKHEHQFYIGSSLFLKRREVASEFFLETLTMIQQKVNQSGCKLIYCSFGTLYYYKNKLTLYVNFLKKLVEIAKKRRQYIFVISADDKVVSLINDSDNNLDNLFIFNLVDQIRLLESCHLFISAGGLNSIKESIYFNTPLLIYPWNHTCDNHSNAAKVEYHGLGLKGHLASDNETDILQKIDKLIEDCIFRQNIINFNKRVTNYKNVELEALFEQLPYLVHN